MNIMLVYVIDKTKTFKFFVGKIDVSLFMDTPDEAIIHCVAKYVFLFTV